MVDGDAEDFGGVLWGGSCLVEDGSVEGVQVGVGVVRWRLRRVSSEFTAMAGDDAPRSMVLSST